MLSERKQRILRAIVEDYIATAEPVGSRTVARRYVPGLSPATIRNEMADLEELGLLEQPYTSAGRIPSDLGYRYYVDHLMEAEPLDPELETAVRALQERARELAGLIQQATRLLADLSGCVAMVLAPQLSTAAVRSLHVVPLGPGRGLVVVVSDAGFIESRLVDLPDDVGHDALEQLGGRLTEVLAGRMPEDLSRTTLARARAAPSAFARVVEAVLELVTAGLEPADERVYLGGTSNILSYPEFRDTDRVRALLSALEQEDLVIRLLAGRAAGTAQAPEHAPGADRGPGEAGSGNVDVTIGREQPVDVMQSCSLVRGTYRRGPAVAGKVGVLGPTRMPYARTVALVETVVATLGEALERLPGR